LDRKDLSVAEMLMEEDYWDLSTMIAWVATRDPEECVVHKKRILKLSQYREQWWAQAAFLELRKALRKGKIHAIGRKGRNVNDRDVWGLGQQAYPNQPPKTEISPVDWHDADIAIHPQSSLGYEAPLYVAMYADECKQIRAPREEVLSAFTPHGEGTEKTKHAATQNSGATVIENVEVLTPTLTAISAIMDALYGTGYRIARKVEMKKQISKRMKDNGHTVPSDSSYARYFRTGGFKARAVSKMSNDV